MKRRYVRAGRIRGSVAGSLILWLLLPPGRPMSAGESREFTGIVTASYDASIATDYPGIVRDVAVKPGDVVNTGHVLVALSDEVEKLEVERRQLIVTDKTELEAARKRVELLAKDLAATRKLLETSRSVSRDEVDRKELEHRLAEAEVQRLEVSESLEAIEHTMAAEQLARRQVRAPSAGIVTKVHIEKGEYAQPQLPLLRLVNIDECYLVCNIPGPVSRGLTVGDVLPIRFSDSGVPATLPGTVDYVSPAVDPASGLREIRLRFSNPEHAVNPGETGTILLNP